MGSGSRVGQVETRRRVKPTKKKKTNEKKKKKLGSGR